jgi:hypothetical protein
VLYPAGSDRFIRLRVDERGAAVGWAVLLDTPMSGHPYFGNLRVGSIVDCLAAPEAAGAVVEHAVRVLTDRGVDLVVTNQAAACWRNALQRAGFLPGPSRVLFAASPALARHLPPGQDGLSQFHLNRGDGDGPINL